MGPENKKFSENSLPPLVWFNMKEDLKISLQAKFKRFWLVENILKKIKKVENQAFAFPAILAIFDSLDFLNISNESKSPKFSLGRFFEVLFHI